MNIIEIDCESYATRVAYAAASELYGLLLDQDGPEPFIGLDGDALNANIEAMGAYVIAHKCKTGEQLGRWFFEAATVPGFRVATYLSPQNREMQLAFDLFVSVCAGTYQKLRCLQVAAETSEPPPNPPLKLEDSIFEPEGSLGELESWAGEAAQNFASYDNAQAERRRQLEEQAAKLEANRNEIGAYGPAMSAGEAPASTSAKPSSTPEPDLPPAPKSRANAGSNPAAKKPHHRRRKGKAAQ